MQSCRAVSPQGSLYRAETLLRVLQHRPCDGALGRLGGSTCVRAAPVCRLLGYVIHAELTWAARASCAWPCGTQCQPVYCKEDWMWYT